MLIVYFLAPEFRGICFCDQARISFLFFKRFNFLSSPKKLEDKDENKE